MIASVPWIWLDRLADALHIPPQDLLKESLTARQFQSAGRASAYSVPLTVQQAKDNRDALCQTMYGSMFNWIVAKVNQTLSAPLAGKKTTVIGVLDIFGFEIFEVRRYRVVCVCVSHETNVGPGFAQQKNSFEQLCINFANEKLQQHFNAHTFKKEEEVYRSEAIQFTHVEFIDNQVVLDLIEKKPNGLFTMLDEEIIVPKGTDQTFLKKINEEHGRNKNERFKQILTSPTKFGIHHYAGAVEYEVDNFLDKNKDTLHATIVEVSLSSAVGFTRYAA